MRQKETNKGTGVLEEAYRQHKDRLLTLAWAIVGERASAEDVVHDVFAHLVRTGALPSDSRRWGAYLTVCARNRALSVVRGNKVRDSFRSGVSETQPADAQEEPSRRAVRAEENGILLKVIGELPNDEKDALALRIWGEMGFAEIGRIQGVTKSSAHARYAQALKRLKKRLAGGTGDE